MEARFVHGVADVPREAWDALIGDDSPFWEWEFLAACEAHSATPDYGALPQHLTLWDDGELIGALPLYVKGDGRAEFIYDWGWYHLAWQVGVEYYPKAVSMSPFTPVTGGHFFIREDIDRASAIPALVEVAESWAKANSLTGLHYLFLTEADADLLESLGYLRRLTFQLALENRGYASFDDYLSGFRSKDRVKIKRDLRIVKEDQGLEIEVVEGADVGEAEMALMYQYYAATVAAHGTGSHYLQRGTWEQLFASDWRRHLVLLFARENGERVAGSMCVQKNGELYGRYWGTHGNYPSLYFALAFYEPTRLLIERGWSKFYVGFGNASYKRDRGFGPSPTHSAHRFFDERLTALISRVLDEERERAADTIEAVKAMSKLRASE